MRSICFLVLGVGLFLSVSAQAEIKAIGSQGNVLTTRANSTEYRASTSQYAGGMIELYRITPRPGRLVKLSCTAPNFFTVEYILQQLNRRKAMMITSQLSQKGKSRWNKGRNNFKKATFKVKTGPGSYQRLVFSRFTENTAFLRIKIHQFVGGQGTQRSWCDYKYSGTLQTLQLSES